MSTNAIKRGGAHSGGLGKFRLLAELLCCVAGFALAAVLYAAWVDNGALDGAWIRTDKTYGGLALSALCFLLSVQFWDTGVTRYAERNLLDMLLTGTGANLLLQSLLIYTHVLEPTPWPLLLLGGIGSSLMLGSVRTLSVRYEPPVKVALLGAESTGGEAARSLHGEVVGIARHPAEVAPLFADHHPSHVLLGSQFEWTGEGMREFLRARADGVVFYGEDQLDEQQYGRVRAESLQPWDLRWFSTFTASQVVQALQAIYSNLIGLGLLVILSPVMFVGAALSRVAAGPGRVFEESECVGFQGVPFRRFRFRTRLERNGVLTPIGVWLQKLRLSELPQLINVVRGEMSILGPAPLRVEAAERLRQLMPFSAHRFTVRPGLFGWAQLHQRPGEIQEEVQCIEYDLYYLKNGTVLFDFEILMQTLYRIGR